MLTKIILAAFFVIVLTVGFNYFFSIHSPSVAPTTDAIEKRSVEKYANDDRNALAEIKFVCDDSVIRPIWIDLLKEKKFTSELFGSKLQKEYDCSEMLQTVELDLNDDGQMERSIRVQYLGVCSPTNNCPIAFYGIFDGENSKMRTSAGIYDFSLRRLLFSKGVMNYEIGDSKTLNYKDILLRFNGNPYDNYLELYKFDGRHYQRVRCFDEDHEMKRTATQCWDDED